MTSEDYNLKHSLFDDLAYEYPMIARKEEWKTVSDFINKQSLGSRTFLIVGDYGCGKTFFFAKIIDNFRKGKFRDSDKSDVISMRLIEGEPESKIGLSFVTRVFKKIGYSKMSRYASKTTKLDERIFDSNFQKIITGIKEGKRHAFDWLMGISLSGPEKTDLGISKNLTTSRDALHVFFNFLKFLKHIGIENVYLLIDEFEYVVTAYNQKQVDATLYLFKDIYDKYGEEKETMAKTIFIIAMTPASWDFLTKIEERRGGGGIVPWFERVNPKINKIQLMPFSESETEELLLQRIKENRIKHKPKAPSESWPFVH
ncbi:MAG: DUF2791 family P-loop domain-containing protein, partial [Patescibacteria group bacterium]|nr:DUF2791 family P-loop domain-containing protein [Patescibacteria group bacterium]